MVRREVKLGLNEADGCCRERSFLLKKVGGPVPWGSTVPEVQFDWLTSCGGTVDSGGSQVAARMR